MRPLLALVCCLSLASIALGADPNNPNTKKKKDKDRIAVPNLSGLESPAAPSPALRRG
jgi:hypothetical protein